MTEQWALGGYAIILSSAEEKDGRPLLLVEMNAAASAEFLSFGGGNGVGWLGWVTAWHLA